MTKGSAKNQILGVFCQLFVAINFGAAVGWTSPSLPVLSGPDCPFRTGPVTEDQLTWIASIISIGCIVGIVVYGWAIEVFGRRLMGILLGLPQTVRLRAG